MKSIDVCLTPELLHLHNIENSIVVVTDIFRATSCMVTGMAHGIGSITPVASVEECFALQQQGYVAAAERNAQKVAGFDLDNSPFSYMDEGLVGAHIAMTTTNGTLSIAKAKASAVKVLVGAFLNLGAVTNYLQSQQYDVLVLCAGWKGKVNLEDTLFAGALVEALHDEYMIAEDGALLAMRTYQQAKDDMLSYLATSSHVRRLQRLGIHKDIQYCLQRDLYDVVPVLRGSALVCA
ncbi:MAG: 2-phosphosulfolactate phosphatase [Runella slithyformis]|jgi:2-phosphosulfolactate phosphatase|nr:MAG: 2-phosphosulfolactate phosphatase [Runella slithyformis]TAF97725.1 MAG: 2-phosphosulfolactate phosphatase [Runella sp.]TAG22721.1 MAG: 2-phosphosulfolactate phosphatase [Cytophagales bacterium]TAG41811.1 MAG: 2-phosphosulfolactate phosphatase [Cytophagia bacterium]TAE93635.1 MAG: 2-phosphosulfolactate phosphatase [Runella slithyformis]